MQASRTKDGGGIEVLAESRANPPIISGRFQDGIEFLIERDDIESFVDIIAVVTMAQIALVHD